MRLKVFVRPTAIGYVWLVHCPVCNHPEVAGGMYIISIPAGDPAPANEYAMMHHWQHGGEL